MEQLQEFVKDQWIIIAGAVIVLLLVVKLVKTAVKWAVILAIVAGLAVYGASYKDKLTNIKDAVVESAAAMVTENVKEQAAGAIRNEAKEAKFTSNADGSFTIKTKTVQVDGKPGSDTVKVTIAGQSFDMKVVDAVQAFIDQAKQNQ